MTISQEQVPYAENLYKELLQKGVDVELDTRDEKIGYKIREANAEQKIPVQLVIGKNEVQNNQVNVRRFGSTESETIEKGIFIENLLKEIDIKF